MVASSSSWLFTGSGVFPKVKREVVLKTCIREKSSMYVSSNETNEKIVFLGIFALIELLMTEICLNDFREKMFLLFLWLFCVWTTSLTVVLLKFGLFSIFIARI